MSDDKMREALMEEAKCMVEYHPSKDAISFARSVLSYLSQQPESEPDDYTADNLAEEVCDRLETILGRGIDGDGSPYSIAVDAVDCVVHAIKESGLQFDDEDNTFRQPSPQVPESEPVGYTYTESLQDLKSCPSGTAFMLPVTDDAEGDMSEPVFIGSPQPWTGLAASLYQACGAYDMPERILDVLSLAQRGEPFGHLVDGLLPCAPQPESVPDDCTADNLADDVAVRIDAMLGVDADYFDCVVCGEPVDLSDMGNCGDCGGVFHWMECGEWGGRRHQCTECREEEDEEAEFGTKTCPGGNPAALERPTGEN